jgi:hypothetical protein
MANELTIEAVGLRKRYVVWSLAIVAVFGPLSAWRYRRSVTR